MMNLKTITMSEKTLDIVFDALVERIRHLETEIYLKDREIERLHSELEGEGKHEGN